MSTKLGQAAEAVAAEFLKERGHKILAQNWRTRFCEIDIVSQKAEVIYFVEVKYRSSANFGNGLEYITARKLRRMRFAAELWLARNGANFDYRLAAISASGDPAEVLDWINDLT